MQRLIVGFHRDENNDWVAQLDCCHGQHVRHNPPFTVRQWTQTAEGRQNMVGRPLECVKCDRLEWPDDLVAYKRTPEFSDTDFPAGLAREHSTKVGVWGRIHVLQGELLYVVQEPSVCELLLTPGQHGTVAPTMKHHVQARGEVRFYVEFYRRRNIE